MNSPEVYLINPSEPGASIPGVFDHYVEPVRILTNSFTKKTRTNDKLVQYTFNIEKSKTLKTQSV